MHAKMVAEACRAVWASSAISASSAVKCGHVLKVSVRQYRRMVSSASAIQLNLEQPQAQLQLQQCLPHAEPLQILQGQVRLMPFVGTRAFCFQRTPGHAAAMVRATALRWSLDKSDAIDIFELQAKICFRQPQWLRATRKRTTRSCRQRI